MPIFLSQMDSIPRSTGEGRGTGQETARLDVIGATHRKRGEGERMKRSTWGNGPRLLCCVNILLVCPAPAWAIPYHSTLSSSSLKMKIIRGWPRVKMSIK